MKWLLTLLLTALPGFAATVNWTNTVNQYPYASGDTVNLYGTFGTQLLVTNNNVTFRFQQGASFSTGAWDQYGAIDLNGKTNLVIDGNGTGFITNTLARTGAANAYRRTTLIDGSLDGEVSHVLICNLNLNAYLRTSYTDFFVYPYGALGINLKGNDLTVSNCNIGDCTSGITMIPGSGTYYTNWNVFKCNLARMNHYIGMSVNENTTVSNMNITGGTFTGATNYDGGGGGNNLHVDYIIIQDGAQPGSYPTNLHQRHLSISGNIFGADYVADLTVVTNLGYTYNPNTGIWTNTAGDFVSHGATAVCAVYNNGGADELIDVSFVNNLTLSHTNETWGNAPISLTASNLLIANNTCIGLEGSRVSCGGAIQAAGINVNVFNNIGFPGYGVSLVGFTTNAIGTESGTNDLFLLTNYLASVWSDKNVFVSDVETKVRFAWGVVNCSGCTPPFSPSFSYLTNWQTYNNNTYGWAAPIWNTSHADPHSVTNAITYNANTCIPAVSDVVAYGQGTNLTSLFSAYGISAVDYSGNLRPPVVNWTIGAFEAQDVLRGFRFRGKP